MIDLLTIRQLKAYAWQDGAFMGAYWFAAFLLTLHFPALALGPFMTLCTPLFAGWLLSRFRDEALEGRITFRRGLAYSVYTLFNGAFLFAFGIFAYLTLFDDGLFLTTMLNSFRESIDIFKQMGQDQKQIYDAIDLINSLSPIEMGAIFMAYYVIASLPLAFIIAFFCKRKQAKTPHNHTT